MSCVSLRASLHFPHPVSVMHRFEDQVDVDDLEDMEACFAYFDASIKVRYACLTVSVPRGTCHWCHWLLCAGGGLVHRPGGCHCGRQC